MSILAIWLGNLASGARQQRRAVAALAEAGMRVHYDYQYENLGTSDLAFSETSHVRRFYPGGFSRQQPEHPAPAWARQMLGDEYFQSVMAVTIEDHFRTDLWAAGFRPSIEAALPTLQKLPELRAIFVHQPRDHADTALWKETVELLKRELPGVEVTEIPFVTIR
jgi:hypothetical protein